jgi:septum formation protein
MTLYLASNSKSRKRLLKEAKIRYKTLEQNYDEEKFNLKDKTINEIVIEIARNKIKCAKTDKMKNGEEALILSSDSLHLAYDGTILGKPKNLYEAKRYIELVNKKKSLGATSICLAKYKKNNNELTIIEYHEEVVCTEIYIYMENTEIDEYIRLMGDRLLNFSGGFSVHGIGAQYVQKIHGSYSGIQGLPIVELKKAIEKIK